MSILLVDEMFPGVVFSQNIKITSDIDVHAIRPWVYLHNELQDGDLQIEILQGVNLLMSNSVNYTDINAAKTQSYAHGFMTFRFDALALRIPEGLLDQEYTIRLSMINHTEDPNNFLGMVRRWEAKTYPTYGDVDGSGEAINDAVEPLGLELFEYTYTK